MKPINMPPWHRTKIICTLGPATDAPGVLEKMVGAGMDVARINASHGVHQDHQRRIEQVRRVSRSMGQPVAVLIDLPGPKFRLGHLPGGAHELHPGERVQLAGSGTGPTVLPVGQRHLLRAMQPGELVYLADGTVRLRVVKVTEQRVECETIVGGTVRSGAGINLPESNLGAVVPTEADRHHIAFACAMGADWLGVSFVQSATDLKRVRRLLSGGKQPLVMAKIEKRPALAELDAIVSGADGVMVARGDLGVETDLAEIALWQKRIIAVANRHARPVVTATQMLESMVTQEQPTRAEVTDVANAVLDGTDAVMLSAETAIGRHPASAVEVLQRVLTATETEFSARLAHDRLQAVERTTSEDALNVVTCQLAARLEAKAILVMDGEVDIAQAIARYRPRGPVIVLTSPAQIVGKLALVWGVAPVGVGARVSTRGRLEQAAHWLYERRMAAPGDVAVARAVTRNGVRDGLVVIGLP